MVEHQKSDLTMSMVYNADYAQQNADYQMSAKGAPLKLGKDHTFARQAAQLIRQNDYSPYAVIETFTKNGWPSATRVCPKTLYSYIAQGLIEDVSVKDLLYQGKKRKPAAKPAAHSRAQNAARSISKRPKQVNERSEIGHWEIDTVKSALNTSAQCLLTLTERKTRAQIIRKLSDGKTYSVVRELDTLEKLFSPHVFKELCKSITADLKSTQ